MAATNGVGGFNNRVREDFHSAEEPTTPASAKQPHNNETKGEQQGDILDVNASQIGSNFETSVATKDAVESRRGFDAARQQKAHLNERQAGATTATATSGGAAAAAGVAAVIAVHSGSGAPTLHQTREFILKNLDQAAALASTGDGEKTAQLLDSQAAQARTRLKLVPATSRDHVLLKNHADNASAQAAAFRAVAPQQGYDAAQNLMQVARDSRNAAETLAKSNHPEDARLLETITENSRVLAQSVDVAATNTNVTMGRALNESYRQIVNASFDRKIADASDNTFFGLRQSPAALLRADKQKMQVVFNELDRTMREQGVSLDRAWNIMFDDAHIDGWNKQPARVPGFPTRQEAAFFLRDNPTTRGLLIPMTDLARGFKEANEGTIDRASGALIKSLQENRQWDIAHQLIDDYQKNARTQTGRTEANQIAGSEGWDKFKTQALDFAGEELPLLVLSTVISGGAGAGVKALATAAKWGPRAVKAIQAGAELATFIPTDRLLRDGISGKRVDWSAGALARDAALGAAMMLGGNLLAKGVGRGWQLVRAQNFGVPALQRMSGKLIGLDAGEQKLLSSLVNPQGTGRLVTKSPVGIETLARLTNASRNEIALLKNARTGETMLIKGTRGTVPQLTVTEAKKLAAEGWELEAHSHLRNLNPSVGDGRVVGEGFGQKTSVIVDRKGNLSEFVPGQGTGGMTEHLSQGVAPAKPQNLNALKRGQWIGKDVVPGDKLPRGYYWREGEIYRKPGFVEKNFAPLERNSAGKIAIREGAERLSVPSVMRTNFRAQVTAEIKAANPGFNKAQLDAAVTAEMSRVQIHHLVPDELVQKTELGKAAQTAGYNLDRGHNLTGLPREAGAINPGEVGHWTNHPKYTAQVEQEVERTTTALKAQYGSLDRVPKQVILDEMKRIETKFLDEIKNKRVPMKDGRLALLNPLERQGGANAAGVA